MLQRHNGGGRTAAAAAAATAAAAAVVTENDFDRFGHIDGVGQFIVRRDIIIGRVPAMVYAILLLLLLLYYRLDGEKNDGKSPKKWY